MSRRTTNNIAALIAGFGTGYLNAREAKSKKEQDDEDRALRRKEIELRIADKEAQQKREQEVTEGLEKANKMRVGELRNDEGAVDNSETAWRERLATPDNEGNVASQEVIDRTAPIYAQQAKKTGAEEWLSSDAPNAIMGEVKPTTKGDIYRSKADAIAKMGVSGIPQSMAMQEKADQLDLADLKKRIASGTPESLAKEYDDIFPDGLTLKFEQGKDGKLYKYTEDAQGNKSNWQTFKDINEFKQQMMALVDDNPDAITKYWTESRKQEREDKMTDLQFQKLDQQIKAGAIELQALPEKTRLDFASKKAAINASNASAQNSIASAKEKISNTGGAKDDKLPNNVREALWYKDANPDQKAAFDALNAKSETKVTSDGMGGFIVNKPDGLYRIGIKGDVAKVELEGSKPQDKNRPPLDAFAL